jgi:hypothetical protein
VCLKLTAKALRRRGGVGNCLNLPKAAGRLRFMGQLDCKIVSLNHGF